MKFNPGELKGEIEEVTNHFDQLKQQNNVSDLAPFENIAYITPGKPANSASFSASWDGHQNQQIISSLISLKYSILKKLNNFILIKLTQIIFINTGVPS